MIRRPPRSTLFPYTRSSDLQKSRSRGRSREGAGRLSLCSAANCKQPLPICCRFWRHTRSEEHTSELQSPCNLVCRLLLEKKNVITCASSTLSCVARAHALLT